MERSIYFARFLHLCIASVALTSLLLMFVVVTTPPETSTPAVTSTARTTTVPPSNEPHDDLSQLVDLASFRFLLNVNHTCDPSDSLLVIVHSSTTNFDKRLTLRKTWGSFNTSIKILFMLGYNADPHVQEMLYAEQQIFNDLIQGNFIDKYRNITYKHVMAFKWIDYSCSSVKYVLKTDDDVFINMPNLINFLPSLPTSNLIFCDVIRHARVKRTWRSKWRVSYQEYASRVYPDYCAGWAILYSIDVVKKLYHEAQADRYFWVDDVHLTGVLAKKAKFTHREASKWILTVDDLKSIKKNNKWTNKQDLLGPFDISIADIVFLWSTLTKH